VVPKTRSSFTVGVSLLFYSPPLLVPLKRLETRSFSVFFFGAPSTIFPILSRRLSSNLLPSLFPHSLFHLRPGCPPFYELIRGLLRNMRLRFLRSKTTSFLFIACTIVPDGFLEAPHFYLLTPFLSIPLFLFCYHPIVSSQNLASPSGTSGSSLSITLCRR